MEINRNQWFLAGAVLLFLGLQFRMVDSLVLTPELTQFLAEQRGHPVATASQTMHTFVGAEAPVAPKTVRPPEWFGWALLSIGSVLILHSLSMKKPD